MHERSFVAGLSFGLLAPRPGRSHGLERDIAQTMDPAIVQWLVYCCQRVKVA